jgi:hypothetical protein
MAVVLNEVDDFKPKDLETLFTDPREERHFTMVATVNLFRPGD